jgi:hypothetical protein
MWSRARLGLTALSLVAVVVLSGGWIKTALDLSTTQKELAASQADTAGDLAQMTYLRDRYNRVVSADHDLLRKQCDSPYGYRIYPGSCLALAQLDANP